MFYCPHTRKECIRNDCVGSECKIITSATMTFKVIMNQFKWSNERCKEPGYLAINDDGSIEITVEDDHYSGRMPVETIKSLIHVLAMKMVIGKRKRFTSLEIREMIEDIFR